MEWNFRQVKLKYAVLSFILIIVMVITVLLFKKGININQNILNHQEQFQYQNQSQLSINLFVARGNIVWRNKEIFKRDDRDIMWSICKELTDLPPEKSYFAKIQVVHYWFSKKYYIFWPEFENY